MNDVPAELIAITGDDVSDLLRDVEAAEEHLAVVLGLSVGQENLMTLSIDARAEIERLRAQLPPEPGPGQHWRVGSKQPRNVYLHQPGDDDGVLIGQFSSPALAHLACTAVNGRDAAGAWRPSGGR